MMVLFHTTSANEAAFQALLAELAPGVPVRHVVRPEFLDEAVAAGGLSPALAARTVQAMREAAQGATVALCTCSTVGECADEAGLLRIDRPMAQAAVAAGPRILLAACVASTLGPTERLVAAEGGRQMDMLLLASAWPHWQRGDRQAYWEAIAAALAPQLPLYDSIVLAQASMAGALPLLPPSPTPVLASPRSGLAAALQAYRSPSTAGSCCTSD